MYKLEQKIRQKKESYRGIKEIFKDEDGAIDLASIMVGIIVIGLIGGVIAATVFAVIPWSQDNAAKHQLESIVAAESAYIGLGSDSPPALPSGHKANSFANSAALASASLLQVGSTYCAVTTDEGKGYQGFSQSSSGKVWTISNENSKPEVFKTDTHGEFPSDCNFITVGFDNEQGTETPSDPVEEEPYVDPTPTRTTLTYKCDTKVTSGQLPFVSSSMSYAWNDGTNPTLSRAKTLEAGKEYIVVAEGTYGTFQATTTDQIALSGCLRSVDHWGASTGVTNANYAFNGAVNLTNVPENIPTTIINMSFMFKDSSSFNDPDIAKWDTSKVTNMNSMFRGATGFNQSLNSWNVSKVLNMQSMFDGATSFNQPLNNWNVSSVTSMIKMFEGANDFNNDLSAWDTSSVKTMALMFGDPFAMKHGVNHNTFNTTTILTYKCDTTVANGYLPFSSSSISYTWNDGTSPTLGRTKTLEAGKEYIVVAEGTYGTFQATTSEIPLSGCLRSVDHWGASTGVTNANYAFNGAVNLTNVPENIPTTITNTSFMFKDSSSFNDPDIDKWNTSKVTNMNSMFRGATGFNQSLNSWNTGQVLNMQSMFNSASSFNQPLNNWNVSNVTDMIKMFEGASAFNNDLSAWDTSSVKTMALMFGDPFAMKHGVKHNTFNTTTTLTYKCDTKVTSGQLPISSMSYAWNDGTNPTLSRAKTLEAGTEYTVVVEGTYGTFQATAVGETLLSNCLRSVDHWGASTGVTNANYAFNGAVNLTNVPENIPTTITNMSFMFKDSSSFNDPDSVKWNTSKVTNMASMFIGATGFNQSLNNWDVSKVLNMQSMFSDATSFNQPLNNWNVSNVTDMIKMFEGASAFNNDLSAWDTSSVVKMALMFGDPFAMKHGVKHNTFNTTTTLTYKCDTKVTGGQLPISSMSYAWNDGTNPTSSRAKTLEAGKEYTVVIEGTYGTFQAVAVGETLLSNCLRSVDHWGVSTGVTNVNYAFSGAVNLTNVPENIPTTITNMSFMFKNSSSFNDPDIVKWNTSKVTNMASMFIGATGFNQNLSGWNTTALTSGTTFAPTSFPDAFMPVGTSK